MFDNLLDTKSFSVRIWKGLFYNLSELLGSKSKHAGGRMMTTNGNEVLSICQGNRTLLLKVPSRNFAERAISALYQFQMLQISTWTLSFHSMKVFDIGCFYARIPSLRTYLQTGILSLENPMQWRTPTTLYAYQSGVTWRKISTASGSAIENF